MYIEMLGFVHPSLEIKEAWMLRFAHLPLKLDKLVCKAICTL